MIFVTAGDGRSVMLMLSEQDVNNMRSGRTVFVDERQAKGATFSRIVLSLHKTNEVALDVIRRSGHKVPPLESLEIPTPVAPAEGRCDGCQGIMDLASLHKGKCIVCWEELAGYYRQDGTP
jgi:hypothetical protein